MIFQAPRRVAGLTNPATRFLIWIGSEQEKTFGPTVSRLIHNNIEPERMILWDTRERGGRPDSMRLLKDTWTSFGAEVIFITSNKQGNDEMMRGCQEGVCAVSFSLFPWARGGEGLSYDVSPTDTTDMTDMCFSRTTCLWYALGFLSV